MDYSQEVDSREGPHLRNDGDEADPTGNSGLATEEQKLASSRPISTLVAPITHKQTLVDPEKLLLEKQGKAESEPHAHVVHLGGESHEPLPVPQPSTIEPTPRAFKDCVPSTGTARAPDHRRRAYVSCEPCRRRKIKCDGDYPCQNCRRLKMHCVFSERRLNRSRVDDFAIKALEAIEQRGRNTSRDDSPPPFQNSDRAMSHSPDSQFYHSEVEDTVDTRPLSGHSNQSQIPNTYQYAPLGDSEIRLLRISPATSQELIHCTLKIISIDTITASVLEFQALSYAWAHDHIFDTIFLDDAAPPDPDRYTENSVQQFENQQTSRTFRIHRNLWNALKQIREDDVYIWLWVDALCIDQSNEHEKSHQIPKMPDIYSNAWNVIVWLGETGRRHSGAAVVRLIPKLLNLKVLDSMLQSERADYSLLESWVSFMDVLYLPWFTRRWVIQEIACARRLSLRIDSHVISWIDFADAVELFLDKLDRMRELYSRSQRARYNPDALQGVETSGARALMELSRNIFRKSRDSQILTRLMDLESLVLSTTNFAVTEVRDVIYALLYLANDITGPASRDASDDPSKKVYSMTTDYSRHPVDIFADFVIYCIVKSQSLDIICRRWTVWPCPSPAIPLDGRALPSWIGVASFSHQELSGQSSVVPGFSLVGAPQKPIYTASREFSTKGQKELDVLEVTGLSIRKVVEVSACTNEATIIDDCLKMLGWTGSLSDGVPDRLWRTLVANRTTDGRMLPGWYRRACALALTKLTPDGHLDIPTLLAGVLQPSTVIEYLKRVQEVVHNRRFFQSAPESSDPSHVYGEDAMEMETFEVGVGPREMLPGDMVCILFGCSVPVILRPMSEDTTGEMLNVKLVGEAYLHDHMEGEILAGLPREEVERRSTLFMIH